MRYSWAGDEVERDEWVSFARGMEEMVLSQVRYHDIDYRRHEVAPHHSGHRVIDAEAEWAEPYWRFPGGHTVDFGVELTDRSGRVWFVTWIPPGQIEGLALDDRPLVAEALDSRARVAIWDVSSQPEWQPLIGEQVTTVRVSYEPWDDAGAWWCRRLELDFPGASVVFLEAQGTEDGTVEPSADNIVVQFGER